MEYWLLLLAFYLSVLTYYLGALIYSLPIPWRGLKRWGPILIYDGAASALLVFSFTLIVLGIQHFYTVLGGSWDYFYAWVEDRIATLISYQMLISMISSVASGLPGFASIWWALNPLLSMVSYAIMALTTTLSLGLVVQRYYVRLLALGVALYAVPFRMARSAGAGLMAFSIVFYLGLPLLPVFVDTMGQPVQTYPGIGEAASMGVAFVEGLVAARDGTPVAYGQLIVYLEGSPVAAYPTDSSGRFDAGAPDKGLPSRQEFSVMLEYAGLRLWLSPNPVVPDRDYEASTAPNANYHLELRASSIASCPQPLAPIALTSPYTLLESNITSSGSLVEAVLELDVQEAGQLVVSVPSWLQASISIDGAPASGVGEGWSWRGVSGMVYRFDVSPGRHAVRVSYMAVGEPGLPDLETLPYLESLTGTGSLAGIIEEVSRLVFTWIVLPSTYLFILTLVTYSLASSLGGRGRIPIPWVG